MPLSSRARAAGVVPLPPSAPGRRAHDIDFTIHGNEMQFVEVELDPGEAAVAEAGSMMYMTDGVSWRRSSAMAAATQPAGVLDALLGAGKRLLTGESLFMTVFTNTGAGQAAGRVCRALRRQDPADGPERDRRTAVCQKDSFLCAARGVSVGIAFQRKIGVGPLRR